MRRMVTTLSAIACMVSAAFLIISGSLAIRNNGPSPKISPHCLLVSSAIASPHGVE
jgi:hypothetical protein